MDLHLYRNVHLSWKVWCVYCFVGFKHFIDMHVFIMIVCMLIVLYGQSKCCPHAYIDMCSFYYITWPLGRHTYVPPDGKTWYHACVLYRWFAICPIWLDRFVNMHLSGMVWYIVCPTWLDNYVDKHPIWLNICLDMCCLFYMVSTCTCKSCMV